MTHGSNTGTNKKLSVISRCRIETGGKKRPLAGALTLRMVHQQSSDELGRECLSGGYEFGIGFHPAVGQIQAFILQLF
jgi:hypothetical protein